MATENDGFKEFVRGEIRNAKDAAQRNYDEHQVIFKALNAIKTKLEVLEERLGGNVEVRKAKIAALASVGAAALTSIVAIVAIIVKLFF